jgi:hypothetical protein
LWRSRWNVDWQGETEVFVENLPQRHLGMDSFESRLGHFLSRLRYFQANTGKILRLVHDSLLSNPSHFIIILPSAATVWTLKSTLNILPKKKGKDIEI